MSEENKEYNCTADTLKHMRRVQELMSIAAMSLLNRGINHDSSKLSDEEKPFFDKYTPKLKNCTYGSDEYKRYLKELSIALENHYQHNSHHPEHYTAGIDGMDLFDLIEMFFDWKDAGERHADGNIFNSIIHNKERFKVSEQLTQIFNNTAINMGWNKEETV